jgi:hypothetical protein
MLKLEISYRLVIISWRILVFSLKDFWEEDYYFFAWWNIWVSILLLLFAFLKIDTFFHVKMARWEMTHTHSLVVFILCICYWFSSRSPTGYSLDGDEIIEMSDETLGVCLNECKAAIGLFWFWWWWWWVNHKYGLHSIMEIFFPSRYIQCLKRAMDAWMNAWWNLN